MERKSHGFTILELMVVLAIGAILSTVAIQSFADVQLRLQQRGAQRAFESLHNRARMMAIESGQTVEFHLDRVGDSIWIERNDTIIDRVNIEDEFGVDLNATSAQMHICFNSRGFGDSSCSSFNSLSFVSFRSNGPVDDQRYLFWLPAGGLVQQSGTG